MASLLVKYNWFTCILLFHTGRKKIGCPVISLLLHQNMEICLYICFTLNNKIGNMETENVKDSRVHQGANVSKIRRYEGMKQLTLAQKMGVSQQFISQLEQQREIGKEYLDKIASILNVAPEVIENMEETPISVVIENNSYDFESGSNNNGIGVGYVSEMNDNKVIHPVEKIIDLSKENASLYERMLANEKEKLALLEKLLNEKK